MIPLVLPCRQFQYASGPKTSENDSQLQNKSFEIVPQQSALLILDAWTSHPTQGFTVRMEKNIRQVLAPTVQAARRAGITIIHASHGMEENALLAPEKKDWVVPPSLSAVQFDQELKKRGITTLLYTGYAVNWCLLFRAIGIYEMKKFNYTLILLRDATLGYETPETLEGEWALKVGINIVEAQFGYSALGSDLIKAASHA